MAKKKMWETILELRDAHPDWSHRQIAEVAGCKLTTVQNYVSKLRNGREAYLQKERERFAAKYTTEEAAERRRLIANKAALKARSTPEGLERVRTARQKWRTANPLEDRACSARWREQNRDHFNAYYKQRNSTPEGRIHLAIRNASRRIVQFGGDKCDTSLALLGCTLEEARLHIEARFAPGMTWANHGEWELDHIRPIASWDMTDPEQVKACAHFTNLQPLWAYDNRSKGGRYDGDL